MNSAGGSCGLSFGLAFAGAILLAALSVGFTSVARSSTVLSGAEQQQVAKVLEHDAQVVSNTQLEKQLAGQPQKTQDEIIRINTQARHLALSGGASHTHPRWFGRAAHLVPYDAPARSPAIGLRRAGGLGLTRPPDRQVSVHAHEPALDRPAINVAAAIR